MAKEVSLTLTEKQFKALEWALDHAYDQLKEIGDDPENDVDGCWEITRDRLSDLMRALASIEAFKQDRERWVELADEIEDIPTRQEKRDSEDPHADDMRR
jgi:hypothetical protein